MAALRDIAQSSGNQRHKILAIRGLARLAAASEPADVDTLKFLRAVAPRRQEKLLVLGAAGNVSSAEVLVLVGPLVDDADLVEEAALAAVSIAEKVEDGDKDAIRAAMQEVLAKAKGQLTRERAQKVIDAL